MTANEKINEAIAMVNELAYKALNSPPTKVGFIMPECERRQGIGILYIKGKRLSCAADLLDRVGSYCTAADHQCDTYMDETTKDK